MKLPRMTLTRTLALLAVLAAACAPSAYAAAGGASPGSGSEKKSPSSKSGGSGIGGETAKQRAARKKRAEAKRIPVLAGFALSHTGLVDGAEMTLRYRITAPAKKVRVRGIVRTKKGVYVKTLELGVHRTNVLQVTKLSTKELAISRAGGYKLRLTARDGAGRAAKRKKKVPAWLAFSFTDHRFPVSGPFSFGGDGARFGAGRPGHTHQGQDVVADSGVTLVAPYAGKISYVAYQAAAAGYYVVEHADDGRDYVFMHLLKDSTAVSVGQRVSTGSVIGKVGATGDASGPHLHFEIWVDGPWQFGGHPVDPLPLLKSWFASGPGGAVRTSSAAAAFDPTGSAFD
jgi:murein DD-endopeptidase MepM/ murein hydrolase activator NlpD